LITYYSHQSCPIGSWVDRWALGAENAIDHAPAWDCLDHRYWTPQRKRVRLLLAADATTAAIAESRGVRLARTTMPPPRVFLPASRALSSLGRSAYTAFIAACPNRPGWPTIGAKSTYSVSCLSISGSIIRVSIVSSANEYDRPNSDQRYWRAMFNFRIRDCKVVRFIPRRAAAPSGPPTWPFGSSSAFMIACRSVA
jgi:hypothetical protein